MAETRRQSTISFLEGMVRDCEQAGGSDLTDAIEILEKNIEAHRGSMGGIESTREYWRRRGRADCVRDAEGVLLFYNQELEAMVKLLEGLKDRR